MSSGGFGAGGWGSAPWGSFFPDDDAGDIGDSSLELEIPAMYLDSVVASGDRTAAAHFNPFVANFDPEIAAGYTSLIAPKQAGAAIDFDVVDFGSDNINQASLQVSAIVVDGTGTEINPELSVILARIGTGTPVDAVINGAFQVGWPGVYDPNTDAPADTLRVRLQPVGLPNRALVQLTITVQNNNGDETVSVWYALYADITPPHLVSAVATSTKTIRATFSEAVVVDINDPNSGILPGVYTLEPQIVIGGIVPAVTPIVMSVTDIDPVDFDGTTAIQFDLTTDIDLTPGVQYKLTATSVTDPSSNTDTTFVIFDSFVPPIPLGREFDLYRFLPLMNRQEDTSQDLLRFIRCLQEPTQLLLYDIDRWTEILDIDTAPEVFLDAMLDDLGNPFPFVLTVLQKRKLLSILVSIYKRKGTARGIVDAIRFFLGLTVTVVSGVGDTMELGVSRLGVDWILGPGNSYALYSFRVVSGIALTPEQRDGIRVIANYMKTAHEHFVEIVEPVAAPSYDPVVLGVSQLGVDWLLHETVIDPMILGVSLLGDDWILHGGPMIAPRTPIPC